MVIDFILDEMNIHKFYEIRGKGRNDWPVIVMWNSFLASYLFEYWNILDLLRELK